MASINIRARRLGSVIFKNSALDTLFRPEDHVRRGRVRAPPWTSEVGCGACAHLCRATALTWASTGTKFLLDAIGAASRVAVEMASLQQKKDCLSRGMHEITLEANYIPVASVADHNDRNGVFAVLWIQSASNSPRRQIYLCRNLHVPAGTCRAARARHSGEHCHQGRQMRAWQACLDASSWADTFFYGAVDVKSRLRATW